MNDNTRRDINFTLLIIAIILICLLPFSIAYISKGNMGYYNNEFITKPGIHFKIPFSNFPVANPNDRIWDNWDRTNYTSYYSYDTPSSDNYKMGVIVAFPMMKIEPRIFLKTFNADKGKLYNYLYTTINDHVNSTVNYLPAEPWETNDAKLTKQINTETNTWFWQTFPYLRPYYPDHCEDLDITVTPPYYIQSKHTCDDVQGLCDAAYAALPNVPRRQTIFEVSKTFYDTSTFTEEYFDSRYAPSTTDYIPINHKEPRKPDMYIDDINVSDFLPTTEVYVTQEYVNCKASNIVFNKTDNCDAYLP